MRLLHTTAIKLKDFSDVGIPRYAILSHRWEDEEVLFKDIESDNWEQMAGANKIVGCCREAAQFGFDWVWIDTCAIDKSSSAELQETINSMYFWYQRAGKCITYLSDVLCCGMPGEAERLLNRSLYFTRGWTLQELIAPIDIVFFDGEWNSIGTKSELIGELSSITGIDIDILNGRAEVQTASIAKRMSWAAHRMTTRIEDQAYCLLGLFSVKMPMLYGEREAAFIRLQEEIMKHSDDHSLFAWEPAEYPPKERFTDRKLLVRHRGLLAESPLEFARSRHIRPNRRYEESAPYSMTNKGLSIALNVKRFTSAPRDQETGLVAVLDCVNEARRPTAIAIRLSQLDGLGQRQYARSPPFAIISVEDLSLPSLTKLLEPPTLRSIYVRQDFSQPVYFSPPKHFYIRNWMTDAYSLELDGVCVLQEYHGWNSTKRHLSVRTESYQDFVHLYFKHKRSLSSSTHMGIRITLRMAGDTELRSRITTNSWLSIQPKNSSDQAAQHRYTYKTAKLPYHPTTKYESTPMVILEEPYHFSHDKRDYLLYIEVGLVEDQGARPSNTFIVDVKVKQQTPLNQADVQEMNRDQLRRNAGLSGSR
ncbi:MAG: hypothetical protein Q9165_003626 [Trypethelium subeluteriae]